jgi:hypothetical protein
LGLVKRICHPDEQGEEGPAGVMQLAIKKCASIKPQTIKLQNPKQNPNSKNSN